MKLLGVILCYNDADILADSIENMLAQNHDLVIWDHGSTDETSTVINQYKNHLLEYQTIPRSFDFYKLYQRMSSNIIDKYIHQYDWVSWPDQDEFLEGPSRDKSYVDFLEDVSNQGYDSICFNNMNYWFTSEDDTSILSPVQRIHRYSIFSDCSPRIRSWRASATNIRKFNHNSVGRFQYPINFNLRHYPMRSHEQMLRRINFDRANLRRGRSNYHYDSMAQHMERLTLDASSLHYDNFKDNLSLKIKYEWKRDIYKEFPETGNWFSRIKKIIKFH